MNLIELNNEFEKHKSNYNEIIKQKILYSLSKKELQNYIDKIITLKETYESIYGELYVIIDTLSGNNKISAQNLRGSCDIYIRHLNPMILRAENLLNQKNNHAAIRRDIWILILSIIISTLISIITPTLQKQFNLDQDTSIEKKIDEIMDTLKQNNGTSIF